MELYDGINISYGNTGPEERERAAPLPAEKVPGTRRRRRGGRGITVSQRDRKSLLRTGPIKIWACQTATPHHRGLSAVDASREGMKSA